MNTIRRLLKYVFSVEGTILIPVFLLLYIVISNFGGFLSLFGYETRESLKIKLAKTEQQLVIAQEELVKLREKNQLQDTLCNLKETVVEDLMQANDDVDVLIEEALKHPNPETQVAPPIEVELDVFKEAGKESVEIVSINRVYDSLFGA